MTTVAADAPVVPAYFDAALVATRLNRAVFVRSLDAIHLVTARAEGFERIYSTDRYLLAAAGSSVSRASTR